MLKSITNFLNARNERKLMLAKVSLESIQAVAEMTAKLIEMKTIASQHKCLTCEHKYKHHNKEKVYHDYTITKKGVKY